MWLKLCLLLIYLTVLFVLARLLEAVTWYETGSLSRRLLDPMTLSVAKLKALLELRGVNYDIVVEKTELSQLVKGSGPVHKDEVEDLQTSEDVPVTVDTNFTSGLHFYEQVEDAKDSVWLVQVITGQHHKVPAPLSDSTWKAIRKKVTKFGIHTGILDCRLDPGWCKMRGWNSPHLLLALPQVHQQKANVATHTYSGPLRHHAIYCWIREKLHEKIETIQDFRQFKTEWLTFRNSWEEAEIRAVHFTKQDSIPLFFSALSVKFPGRVKFGVVKEADTKTKEWTYYFDAKNNLTFPTFLILTNEGAYTYSINYGEGLTFTCMETFLKMLHPCSNDIFILSFLAANIMSVFELFLSQGGIVRRLRRFLWCLVKYNAAVIMLWLPLIALFQLPYVSKLPLLGLKFVRLLTTSIIGAAMRRDYFFYSQHLCLLNASFLSVCTFFGCFAYWMTGGQYEEDSEPWFNFAQMRTLTHLRPNEFFEPMLMSGYELSGGMEIFGSRLSVPTMSLQPLISTHYIDRLPTWEYLMDHPQSIKSSNNISTNLHEDRDSKESSDKLGNEHDLSVKHCHCYTSASDLLDGNYCCECRRQVEEPHAAACSQHSFCQHVSDHTSATVESDSSVCSPCSACSQTKKSNTFGTVRYRPKCNSKAVQSKPSVTCNSEPLAEPLKTVSGFPEGYLPCSQCVICLDEFLRRAKLCGLPCGHIFHHSCILTWLKRDHHFCPVCRWPSFRPHPLHPTLATFDKCNP